MGFRRRFEIGLALRLTAAIGLILLFILSLGRPHYLMVQLVLAAASAGAILLLWGFIGRANRAVSRFVESIRYDDFAQRFSLGDGGGYDELGTALDAAIAEMGRRHLAVADEIRFQGAIIDDTPIALLMVEGDQVSLLNKAARRQFGMINGTRIADYSRLGSEFQAALALPSVGRRMTRMHINGVPQRTVIEAASIERLGREMRILSILPVQGMLGNAEMAAQSDLVRVLTHEIMNSLTPVTSLARTAAELLASPDVGDNPALADARLAIDTVARRAEGMHRFVESYRAFANAPDVRRRPFDAQGWAAEIARLFAADPASNGVAVVQDIGPGVQIDGDPELLAQLCLNLLRNGAVAAAAHAATPEVRFAITRETGGPALITVSDNGPGIPPERREDIFLPFYTTRAEGNGVGLSFVRQIVVAHGGAIAVEESPGGGAQLRILIP